MKRKTTKLLHILFAVIAAIGILSFGQTAHAAEVLTAPYVPDDAWELAARLNIGWNLGNSLEVQNLNFGHVGKSEFADAEQLLGNPVTTKELIEAVADRGFSSIRIPVSFYNHLLESKPKVNDNPQPGTTIDPDWLDRVEQVVKWALDAGMYVVINNHHDTSMWMDLSWIYAEADETADQAALLTNLWKQVADHFRDYDHRLIFQATGEIVNRERSFDAEDYDDFRAAHDINQAFIDTVRATGGENADRFLILPTYAANSAPMFVDESFYDKYSDPAQEKLLFSVHNYATDTEELTWTFEKLYNRALNNNMPFVIDECGAMITENMDVRRRVSYTLTNLAAKYGMAVFVWDGGSAEYGYIDRKATIETGQIAYVTSWTYKGVTYETDSEAVVEALFQGKYDATPVTQEERQKIWDLDQTIHSVDFSYLNRSNFKRTTEFGDYFTYGSYTQSNKGLTKPVSLYMPSPKYYACLYPYIKTQGTRFQAILPEGIIITIRELAQDGSFIGNKYITKSEGRYVPSENSVYAAVCFRSDDESKTLEDYRRFVSEGTLELYPAGGEPYCLTGISITTPPAKTVYTAGERFDASGMVVTGTYNDTSSAPVTGYTVSPSGTLKTTDTSVKISYTEGGVTKEVTQLIKVNSSGGSSGGGGGITPKYTLIYNTGGGSVVKATKHTSGMMVNLTAMPTREGYTFTGWYEDAALTNKITSVKMDGDKTVYAGWKENETPVHNCPSAQLKDIDPNAWYHEYVDYVVEKGLMQGMIDDLFGPEVNTSRAMIVTILYRLENSPAVEGSSPFEDVAEGLWYTDAVKWAEANEIVEGYSSEKFGPGDLITREQLAAIMYRYSAFKGYDISKAADLAGYTDASAISDWALAAMKWANAENLITGRTETTLVPKGEATRAEAAAILMRFIENVK